MRLSAMILLSLVGMPATRAAAAETMAYNFDAKGRLIHVTHSGSVNNDVQSTYTMTLQMTAHM